MKGRMISLLLMSIAPLSVGAVDIDGIFAARDFVPYVPAAADLKAKYGAGKLTKGKGGLDYEAYPASKNLCIVAKYQDGLTDPDIEELIIIKMPVCNVAAKKIHLSGVSLRSARIGLGINQLPSGELSGSRRGRVSFLGRQYEVIEFNPTHEPDLFARYYICRGIVVGFSLGVTD